MAGFPRLLPILDGLFDPKSTSFPQVCKYSSEGLPGDVWIFLVIPYAVHCISSRHPPPGFVFMIFRQSTGPPPLLVTFLFAQDRFFFIMSGDDLEPD